MTYGQEYDLQATKQRFSTDVYAERRPGQCAASVQKVSSRGNTNAVTQLQPGTSRS